MLRVEDIYYLSDQFGPKFVKILMIGDIWQKDDNWVFFYKHPCLNNVVKADYSTSKDYGCEKSQLKKWNFEKLIDKYSYTKEFKGCIKISDDIINKIINGQEVGDLSDHPFMNYSVRHDFSASMDQIWCKKVSKEDFRNMKLNRILN